MSDDKNRDDVEKAYWLNAEHEKNAIQKFNYYLIGLNFSILALAINHGFETDLKIPLVVGLLGWLLLLVSGFSGLFVIRREGNFFGNHAEIIKFQFLREGAKSRKEYSEVKVYDDEIKFRTEWSNAQVSKNEKLIKAQDRGFLFGVLCLVISYAYPLICTMFQKAPAVKTALIYLQ